MRVRHAVTGVLAAGGMVAVATVPAWSSAAQVTRGSFHAFAVGEGQDITGDARMVRRTDGKTFVEIHLAGLQPGVTYASHVHAAACANAEADGHYKFDPLGAAAPPNE